MCMSVRMYVAASVHYKLQLSRQFVEYASYCRIAHWPCKHRLLARVLLVSIKQYTCTPIRIKYRCGAQTRRFVDCSFLRLCVCVCMPSCFPVWLTHKASLFCATVTTSAPTDVRSCFFRCPLDALVFVLVSALYHRLRLACSSLAKHASRVNRTRKQMFIRAQLMRHKLFS